MQNRRAAALPAGVPGPDMLAAENNNNNTGEDGRGHFNRVICSAGYYIIDPPAALSRSPQARLSVPVSSQSVCGARGSLQHTFTLKRRTRRFSEPTIVHNANTSGRRNRSGVKVPNAKSPRQNHGRSREWHGRGACARRTPSKRTAS